jgi:hypothetical protein
MREEGQAWYWEDEVHCALKGVRTSTPWITVRVTVTVRVSVRVRVRV